MRMRTRLHVLPHTTIPDKFNINTNISKEEMTSKSHFIIANNKDDE